jgi:hypothetical protein
VQGGERGHLALGDPDPVGIDDDPAPVAGQAPGFDAGFVVVQAVTTLDRVRVQRRDPHATKRRTATGTPSSGAGRRIRYSVQLPASRSVSRIAWYAGLRT